MRTFYPKPVIAGRFAAKIPSSAITFFFFRNLCPPYDLVILVAVSFNVTPELRQFLEVRKEPNGLIANQTVCTGFLDCDHWETYLRSVLYKHAL